MDWDQLSRELVRALRGARTQKALSRRLGYRSNVLFAWESGRDAPSAEKFFRLVEHRGVRLAELTETLVRERVSHELTTRAGVAELLRSLARGRKTRELSEVLGRDRFAVGRWMRGTTSIPLPQLLQWIDVCTLSVVDFVALLTDPAEVPLVARAHEQLVAARKAAAELPWSHAIVHMVDLPAYRALPRHEPGWFASRLGISLREERDCLELLTQMGRLRRIEDRYESVEDLSVDTRHDPNLTRRLASFWMEEGARRVRVPGQGRFAFNTFAVSREDFERLKELQSRYFADLRSVIASSARADVVAVATFQLFPLSAISACGVK